jgi:hypothetical protein
VVYKSNVFSIERIMMALNFPYLIAPARLDTMTSIRLVFIEADMMNFDANIKLEASRKVLLPSPSTPSIKAMRKSSQRRRYRRVLEHCRCLPSLRHLYILIEGGLRNVVTPTAQLTTLRCAVTGDVGSKRELEDCILGPVDAFPPRVERHLLMWSSVYAALLTVETERYGIPVPERSIGEHPNRRTRFWRRIPDENGHRAGYWINTYGVGNCCEHPGS